MRLQKEGEEIGNVRLRCRFRSKVLMAIRPKGGISIKKVIYIDKNIKLTDNHLKLLGDYEIILGNLGEDLLQNKDRVDFLLIHSKLANQVLEQLRNDIFIGVRAHNLDYVDVLLAQEKNIKVQGIAPVGQKAVVEHIMALILGLSKNLIQLNQKASQGKWRNNLGLNSEINDKTICIIGLGEIGLRLKKVCEALEMKVLTITRENSDDLKEYLAMADYVSLNINGNSGNHHFFDENKILMMKQNSFLINTARGSVLDTKALIKHLKAGHLAGAALDVYEEEPYVPDELAEMPNVILTPHMGYMTKETVERMNLELVRLVIG